MDSKIILKHYDYDKREEVVEGEVRTYSLVGNMTTENLASFLSEYLNRGAKNFYYGKDIGEILSREHRTLQGLVVNFCLGVICGFAGQDTDARNEVAIETANKIKKMIENGELKRQPYI